mmetsp:Transcript_52623/g.105632  ORF Transcript_52623/g.105632 Transcript_52623/m.105632 type:complete len:166 (-) Transcript_52623:149-646(-)
MADVGDAAVMIKLRSAEGEAFEVPKHVACMSTVIQSVLDSRGAGEEVLLSAKTGILGKVIEYCRHHDGVPPPEIRKPFSSPNLTEYGASQWDADFAQALHESGSLHELTLVAHELDVKPLLDLVCSKTACLLQGKSPEEIRRQFNLGGPETAEEAVVVEHRWQAD